MGGDSDRAAGGRGSASVVVSRGSGAGGLQFLVAGHEAVPIDLGQAAVGARPGTTQFLASTGRRNHRFGRGKCESGPTPEGLFGTAV